MSKITASEIRQQFEDNTRPQRIIDRIVDDFAQTNEEKADLYDVIDEYARQIRKITLTKQIERLNSEVKWL